MPAIVLLHMSAQDRCSAIANILQSLCLLAREHVPPPRQKVGFVCAENIGHFEPVLTHRSGENVLAALIMSSGSSNSSGLVVERTAVSATCR